MPMSKMIQRVRSRSLTRRMSKADRDALCSNAELYREELLQEWGKKVICDG
jgi:hypothetical protein